MTLRELNKAAEEAGIGLDDPLFFTHEDYADCDDSVGTTVWETPSGGFERLDCGAVRVMTTATARGFLLFQPSAEQLGIGTC